MDESEAPIVLTPGSGLAEILADVMQNGTSPKQSTELADAYDDGEVHVDYDPENTPTEFVVAFGERAFKITVEAL